MSMLASQETQDKFQFACWVLVAQQARNKPGTAIRLGKQHCFLIYPHTGQGYYFIFRSDAGWFHVEIEGREPQHGPFFSYQDALDDARSCDSEKLKQENLKAGIF